ncbi:MAG: hypothetical protein KDD40_08555, partial [Bdellovibrionales bacterium]|nr:hypothetical protein [Bdellovibrionales bacterium]
MGKLGTNLKLLLLGVLFPFMSWADTVAVKEIQAKGVDEGSMETISELIKSAVTSEGHDLVSDGQNAQWVLRPKLLKLGDSYILKIDKMKGKSVQFSTKMKAADLEDMDTVAGRVVRSVMNEETPRESVQVTDVTKDEETRGTRRYKATRQWRIGFGPAWSGGMNVEGGGTNWGLGYIWGIDPDYDLKLNWSFYVPRADEDDNARFTNFALGLNYFWTRAKHSPFLSLEIGYASAAASENTDNIFNVSD